jgi:sortase A
VITWSKAVRVLSQALLILGIVLLTVFAVAHIHRLLGSGVDRAMFESSRVLQESDFSADFGIGADGGVTIAEESTVRFPQRVYFARATSYSSGEVMGILRIASLGMEVPVLEGTETTTLNRGVGRIAGTALPGFGGNIGIAGHRDSFFRPLRKVRTGDEIELLTRVGKQIYRVDQIKVTNPKDVSVLQSRPTPSLTLVTCYPFYYLGSAPKRYIVTATLDTRSSTEAVIKSR